MSKKNKHRNAQFEKHKKAQRNVNRVTKLGRKNLPERDGANTGDPILDESRTFASPADMREQLIRQRLATAPRVPSVADLGLLERDGWMVTATTNFAVYDEEGEIHFVRSETKSVTWNDGPVALGLQLAGLTGEMAKEVWGLNNNGSDKSKPTKEN